MGGERTGKSIVAYFLGKPQSEGCPLPPSAAGLACQSVNQNLQPQNTPGQCTRSLPGTASPACGRHSRNRGPFLSHTGCMCPQFHTPDNSQAFLGTGTLSDTLKGEMLRYFCQSPPVITSLPPCYRSSWKRGSRHVATPRTCVLGSSRRNKPNPRIALAFPDPVTWSGGCLRPSSCAFCSISQ